MKKFNFHPRMVVTACLVMWTVLLLALVSPSLIGGNSFMFVVLLVSATVAPLLTLVAFILLLTGLTTRDPRRESPKYALVARVLGLLIIICVVVSTALAIQSLWYGPLDDNWGNRFVLENTATALGFAGIVLTIVLSALQRDIYWLTRKKTVALDERQLQERREVFETSYRWAVGIVVLAVWGFMPTLHTIPAIMSKDFNDVPGHVTWIGINLIVLLFALPLLVKAFRKSHAIHP